MLVEKISIKVIRVTVVVAEKEIVAVVVRTVLLIDKTVVVTANVFVTLLVIVVVMFKSTVRVVNCVVVLVVVLITKKIGTVMLGWGSTCPPHKLPSGQGMFKFRLAGV